MVPLPDIHSQLKECRSSLVRLDIDLNKILDDILVCPSRNDMEILLASSRKLALAAEEKLDVMDSLASRVPKPQEKDTYRTEVEERTKQFKTLQSEIKSAVAQRLSILEKQQRAELISPIFPDDTRSRLDPKMVPGVRNYMTQEDIVKNNSYLTENLSRLTRNLARQVDQSGEAIKTLATSSETLTKASDEFQNMGSTIQQGGRLMDKYDRRQFTDKILITLAFAFFFLICSYIVNKRMFGGFNWFKFFFEFFFPSNSVPETRSASSTVTPKNPKEL